MVHVAISQPENTYASEIKSSWRSWLVVMTASLFFFYEFVQMNMFNAISPALLKEFSITAAQLGAISANYFYGNVLCLFFAGMILDRLSVRLCLSMALSLAIVGTLGFSLAEHIWLMDVSRFFTGLASSFVLLSCIKLTSRWFPPRRMALVIGLVVTMAMLGGMLAQTPLTLLTDHFNWRMMLRLNAGMGVIFLILIITIVRDFPPRYQGQIDLNKAYLSAFTLRKVIAMTLKNSQNWLGGLYTSLMNLPIFLLGAIWGSLYLVQVHHLTRTESSFVTSMIFIGTIIGSPAIGWISDTIGLRRKPMIIFNILSLISMLMLMYMPHLNLWALMGLFFAIGFFTSAQIISYPLVAESNHPALTASSNGLASVLIMSGGFTQPFFGYLMGLHWVPKYVAGVPFYSVHDYRVALMIMPIAFVLSLMMALLVKETYCKMTAWEHPVEE